MYARGRDHRVRTSFPSRRRKIESALKNQHLFERNLAPNPRQSILSDRNDGRAREPEVDEPLLEQPPRHLLQQRDPPPVYLDQVVIGAEDGGDAALGWKRRTVDVHFMEYVSIYPWYGSGGRRPDNAYGTEKIAAEPDVVSFEILDIQRGVKRPKILFHEVNFT